MASPLDSATSRPSSGVSSVISPPQRIPSRSRTQSISSDRPSTVAYSMMSPPLSVSPEPAFIAASAASQIVTNDHDSHAETWYDQHGIEPSGETAAVSPGALQLVNNFLDQLLFNFLSVSRATTLSALRPAVSDVLKPKLAKDAINQADEELREYLGGDDEDSGHTQVSTDWDLELAWKRTRLRCMVYSSLGDLEEEDEDYYMEQGHLDTGPEDRFAEAVSPAVAIFLTSILEFMGEQALIVAGQAAYHRMRSKYEKELKEGARTATGIADMIVVEELDMERVALDRTLGRLWRSWKKKIRSPVIASMDRLNRSYSRDSLRSASGHMCSPSSAAELGVPATVPEPHTETELERSDSANQDWDPQGPLEESLIAAGIPLPMGPNDVAEIEMPGLALHRDDETEEDGAQEESARVRPRSLTLLPRSNAHDLLTLKPSTLQLLRRRSNSLPIPARPRHVTPSEVQVDQPVKEPAEVSEPAQAGPADSPAESRPGDIADAESDLGTGEHVTEEDELKDEDDDEVSIEEPRIVRSSRVSILGRSPSTASSEHGKPAAINTSLPVRTPSIHSARLIDVTSPRSPVPGSRRSSVAVSDPARHSSPSGTTRAMTPPVSEDRPEPSFDGSSGGRSAVHHGAKSGLAASVSISEMEQHAAENDIASASGPVTSATQAGASLPAAPEPVVKEQDGPAESAVQGHVRELSTPPKAMAKTTVFPAPCSPVSPASTASSSFFIETMPVLPEGMEALEQSRAGGQRYRSSPTEQLPAVPEKSIGRQTIANTSALRQPAAIGQVSVERSRARSLSQESSTQPREQSAGRTRQQTSSSSPSSTKLKPVRASEEGVQARIDVVRDFEELIQSDETIQYTLTPESMRDFDLQSQSTRSVAAGGSAVSVKTRKSEEARQGGSRSRSSSSPRSETKPRSSGSGSSSVTDTHQANRNFTSATGKHGGVVPRSLPPVPSNPRATSGPQPRDAKLPRESVAELAEFIRSTGPAGGVTGSAASVGPGRIRNQGSVSNISISTGRMSTTSNPNRPKYQARGATVDYRDDNSDLIDFIRRGPPNGSGNPRIPRAIAPFRTTMDSDQLSGVAIGGRAVDAQLRDGEFRSSPASTHVTESSVPPSVQSSINSHSALLARNNPTSYDAMDDDDMPMPKRKTRRVRDPYAIDLSDEEELEDDDELTPMPPKKRAPAKEESLIDFLNNCPPPQDPTVQPLNIVQTRSLNNNNLKPKKKASAPSLMARFTRWDSSAQQQQQPGALVSAKRPSSPKVSESARGLNSRAGGGGGSGGKGGHVPIQVNIPGGVGGVDQYAPPIRTSSKVAATLGGGGPSPGLAAAGSSHVGGGGRGPRVPMKRFEPREAVSVSNRTATSDLADFLKHSGPPGGGATVVVSQLPGGAGEKGEAYPGISSRVFGRRKKPSFS